MRRVLLLARGVMCVPRGWGVLVCGACQHARSTAPTVLAREMRRPALRPPRSAIVRLRSGAVASRSGAFRLAAFRCGGGGPRGWHGRAGASAWRSLRADACAPFGFGFAESSLRKLRVLRRIPACPCGVRCAPHPPMSGIRLGRNTSRRRAAAPVRRCAHPAARARSGPVPAARLLAR